MNEWMNEWTGGPQIWDAWVTKLGLPSVRWCCPSTKSAHCSNLDYTGRVCR
jgi:hypothetical protein